MQAFPVTFQEGMSKLNGHWYLGPGNITFVCAGKGSMWGQAIGQAVGGAVGGLVAALAEKKPGQLEAVQSEAELARAVAEHARAVAEHPGSMVMAADKIEIIKSTIWMRMMKYNGKRYGFPQGLSAELKPALHEWAKQHGVKTKGLVKGA